MKQITTGTEILFKNTAGRLIKYSELAQEKFPSDCILFSERLSNDLAIDAVNSGIQGIITRKTSFAAHGANILRGSDIKITWITNVDIDLLIPFENTYIVLDTLGNIYSSSESDISSTYNLDKSDDTIKYRFSSPPLNDTSIIDYNLFTDEQWICYWKYNYFSKYIFSSLSRGIQNEFAKIYNYTPLVKRTDDGKIWVKTDITHSQMLEYCCHPNQLLRYMKLVKKNYTQILADMSLNILTKNNLQKWLIQYYSTFTLIHRSYEYVLYKMYEKIASDCSTEIAVKYMDYLMNSKIDRWLVINHNNINNSKEFMIQEKLVPIPSFTIEEDIQEALHKTEHFFKQMDLLDWYQCHKDLINSGVYLFVIKEWKFVLYKLLTSRCFYFYSNCENSNIDIIAESSCEDLEEKYGNQKVIIPC